jgi:autotransporter passenger strand-loop-strand repeat protein
MKKSVCRIKVMAIVLVSMLVRTSVSWAVDDHVLSGSERRGGIVAQGDRHVVHSESVVIQTTVRGIQEIHALGTAVRTLILAGGVQRIIGGRAIGTTIKPQGEQHVRGNSRAEDTTIEANGLQRVSRGRAERTTVNGL